ncbi:MAG: hypothetical protein MJ108_09440 [Saccharofermentans sp.]|nr:hypothetical protein [Saccharofermentans sp.]
MSTENENYLNPEMKALTARIESLETINHAMWLMLQRLGSTNEEFDAALAYVFNTRKNVGKINSRGMGCPACGKSAQLSSDNMRIKCIYCGNEAVINPYELLDMVASQPVQEETPVMQEPVQTQQVIPDYAQPYDVSKDLNFDDLM